MIEQPPGDIEFFSTDGIFIKQMIIAKKDTLIPQHSHCHDHLSMLAVGSVRVWADGILVGDFIAPTGITILKGIKHTFLSLEDHVVIYCTHNLHGLEAVKIDARHELVGG